MLALLLVEPYKRHKLARTLEQRLLQSEEEARERMRASITSVEGHLERLESALLGPPDGKDDEAPSPGPTMRRRVPRSPFPAMPTFAWVQELKQWWASLREHVTGLTATWLPATTLDPVTLGSSAAGTVLAALCTYWTASLFM